MIAAAGDLAGTRVLVAGPESGYLAALVSRLAESVVQIEFNASRAGDFVALYQELNYANIEVRSGAERISEDSSDRFDRILLAYGTDSIPITLIARLALVSAADRGLELSTGGTVTDGIQADS